MITLKIINGSRENGSVHLRGVANEDDPERIYFSLQLNHDPGENSDLLEYRLQQVYENFTPWLEEQLSKTNT